MAPLRAAPLLLVLVVALCVAPPPAARAQDAAATSSGKHGNDNGAGAGNITSVTATTAVTVTATISTSKLGGGVKPKSTAAAAATGASADPTKSGGSSLEIRASSAANFSAAATFTLDAAGFGSNARAGLPAGTAWTAAGTSTFASAGGARSSAQLKLLGAPSGGSPLAATRFILSGFLGSTSASVTSANAAVWPAKPSITFVAGGACSATLTLTNSTGVVCTATLTGTTASVSFGGLASTAAALVAPGLEKPSITCTNVVVGGNC